MKTRHLLLTKSALFLFLITVFLGCDDQLETETPPPNLSGLVKLNESQRSSGNARVGTQHQIYAFAGDNLYRVHPDTREVQFLGSGWSGTEAVTVLAGNIYGVQGGHLWRCNLTTESCVDLGPNWGGTTALTNDGTGWIFGAQGGRIWKVNPGTGQWAQLGIGDWIGVTDMGFSRDLNGVRRLLVEIGEGLYQVEPNNGTWTLIYGNSHSPYVTHAPFVCPNWNETDLDGKFFFTGISGGVVTYLWRDSMHGGQSTVANSSNLVGITDVTYVQFQSGSRDMFALRNGTIDQLRTTPSFPDRFDFIGTVGLSGVYKITSQQGL
jgi:hypothetical protein